MHYYIEFTLNRLYCTAETVSYDQLLHLKKPDGSSLRVIRWISSLEQWQCTDLAHMLLKDDDLVNKYEQEYKKEEFVRKVLKDWLSRDGGDSAVRARTWSSLAECISDADLPGDLATAINDACAGENYSCEGMLHAHICTALCCVCYCIDTSEPV